MKAKDFGNGNIKTYSSVPKSYKNIINFHLLSDSDQESHGFYNVNIPTITASQELGAIEWDSANSEFTYPVVNKTYSKTLAELKTEKIENLKAIYNNKLSKTDWYVTRKQEKGTTIPSDIQTERDNLRTECTTKESEIIALSGKSQVVDYQI